MWKSASVAGRPRRHVTHRDRTALFTGEPLFRLVALEAVDGCITGTAMGIEARRIDERQHVSRVKADRRIEIVVLAFCRLDRLGETELLGRFAEEDDRALEAMAGHHGLGGKRAGKR